MTALWERFKLYWFTGVKCPRCGGRFPARGNDVSETPKGVTYVCPDCHVRFFVARYVHVNFG